VWNPPAGTAPKEIDAKFQELEGAETKRSVDLNKELARQLRLHKLHKRFLANADKFSAWASEKASYLATTEPIDNVEPAEDALEVLGHYNKEYTHVISSQLTDLQAMGAEFDKERFEHRGAVNHTLGEFKSKSDELVKASNAKKGRLEAELQKQKDINDKLCVAFATSAKDFLAWLGKKMGTLSDGGGKPLEAQLAEVQAAASDSKDSDSKLQVLAQQEAAVHARNIDVNPHTGVSLADLKAQWTQFLTLLAKKQELLAEQIEEAKRGGLSPEQMEEIHQNFVYFDKDKSGHLNKRELKACLSSLGEESNPAAVQAMLAQYDKDKSGTLTEPEFAEYMKKQMGDSGQQEQLLQSFKYLSYDKDHVLESELTNVVNGKTFKDHHVEYLKGHAKRKGAGLDYVTWTAEAFAR
jgi:Ca2+-binding EF-hand superfamily protein